MGRGGGPAGARSVAPAVRHLESGRKGEDDVVFTGRYERQLDPKGRLTLPAHWKADFAPRCYLTSGPQGCVDVLTPRQFEEELQRMKARVDSGETEMDEFRLVVQSTYEADVDRQGRVNVDRELRDYARLGLDSRIVVAGSFDKVEIWNEDDYRTRMDQAKARRRSPGASTAYATGPTPGPDAA